MGVYSDTLQVLIRHEETGGEAVVSAESLPHWEQLGWVKGDLPDPDAPEAEPEPEVEEPTPPKKTRGRKAEPEAESANTTTEEGEVNG